MILINNFNLLVSTSRFNESNAKAELWFTLLICGDQYPIISNVEYSGLITAFTSLNAKEVIKKIQDILKKDPNYFQYILKIIPIDFVCETNEDIIHQMIQTHYKDYMDDRQSFKIYLKRRKSLIIKRERLIINIAKIFINKVDLNHTDIIVRIEVLGSICGISFLNNNQTIKVKKEPQRD